MPDEIRIWEIAEGEKLKEICQDKLNLEERLGTWVENDISILSKDLLVIGREVSTDYGGTIDLLCIDQNGDLVIIELKRDRTPREVTAQALDYASWIKDLSREKVSEIANYYFGNKRKNLEQAFLEKFGAYLPEMVNAQHKIVIVASQIDSSTERIIKYLSETYGVRINAATFHYFRDASGRELLARKFLIEPEQIEKPQTGPKREPNLTYQQLEEIAETNGVGEVYRKLWKEIAPNIFWTTTTKSSITFTGTGQKRNALFGLIPSQSNADDGLKFKAYLTRLSEYLGTDEKTVDTLLPKYKRTWQEEWSGLVAEGYFKTEEEVSHLLHLLAKLNETRKKLI